MSKALMHHGIAEDGMTRLGITLPFHAYKASCSLIDDQLVVHVLQHATAAILKKGGTMCICISS